MAKSDSKSELISAAGSLDAELTRFDEATNAFKKLPLNSQKNLERATKMLNDLADGEAALGQQVQLLVAAIAKSRDRQLGHVEVVRVKAEEIKNRTLEMQGLVEQFKSLGNDAAALNATLQNAPTAGQALVDFHAQMGELAARAQALAEIAKSKDFEDLSRQADGLRQQLLAVRAKLKHLEPTLPS
jgi:chromosome segregation ATPase